jgi:hypothetical protein
MALARVASSSIVSVKLSEQVQEEVSTVSFWVGSIFMLRLVHFLAEPIRPLTREADFPRSSAHSGISLLPCVGRRKCTSENGKQNPQKSDSNLGSAFVFRLRPPRTPVRMIHPSAACCSSSKASGLAKLLLLAGRLPQRRNRDAMHHRPEHSGIPFARPSHSIETTNGRSQNNA